MDPNAMESGARGSASKVVLTIVVILVIAAIAFALARSNGDSNDTATTTNGTSSGATSGGEFSGNVFNLVARGGDWKCTWSSEEDGVELSGTVYVSRGKFKSDVSMTGTGVNATAHALGDGQFVYSWTSMMPGTGFKIPMQAATGPSGAMTQDAQLAGQYNYDCDSWRADAATFALPSGVTFTEGFSATP